MTDTTADAAQNTANDAAKTTTAARRTAASARETATAAKSQIKQSVEEIRAEVGREVNVRAQQARDWAEDRADQIRTTVTEKPFASAGAAFAAGVILGVLLARR